MSDPKIDTPPAMPGQRCSWLGGSVVTLLVLQLGLLWIQGSQVQRQREDILGLREDVQAMADSLDEDQQGGVEGDGRPVLVRMRGHGRVRGHRPARLARVTYFQARPDPDEGARKELDQAQRSAQEAVAKAREVQGQLSLSENARKAQEKAQVDAEGRKLRPWLWAGAGLALLAMLARSVIRKRG